MANPGSNFDNIAAATSDLIKGTTVLNTELPGIRKHLGIQGIQAILAELRAIKDDLRGFKDEVRLNYLGSKQLIPAIELTKDR
jgi:hypothetical protein